MKNVLGIDISGRSLKMKGYDSEGNCYMKHIAIANFTKEQLMKNVKEFIAKCGMFEVIGIAQSGFVQDYTLINSNRHPDLNGLTGKWFVDNGLCQSATLINDAAAVVAYAHLITGSNNVASLIIGTGLGCAIWKNQDLGDDKGFFRKNHLYQLFFYSIYNKTTNNKLNSKNQANSKQINTYVINKRRRKSKIISK